VRVTAVGCSGSFPGPASSASCYLVQTEVAGRTWSVALDLGNGALGPLQCHLDPRILDAVILSHLHPDHCLDLCGLHVLYSYTPPPRRAGRLPVHAPPGAAQRLARAYGVNAPEPMDDWFAFTDLSDATPFQVGPFTITPYRVNHPVEAYGLRVEADSAVLAYTGDTDICDNLSPLCTGADLMLADCAFVDGRDDIRDIHLSGSRAAQAAVNAGGVRRLMLTHMPSWNDPQVCRAQAATVWPGEVELCRVGMTYPLP
jgi:ribonuclease BN (tRNA processing enzyme)